MKSFQRVIAPCVGILSVYVRVCVHVCVAEPAATRSLQSDVLVLFISLPLRLLRSSGLGDRL